MTRPSISPLGFAMWLCAAVFYGFQFLIRVSPSYFALDMMKALSLESCAFGTVSSFYYTGYSFMQIPAGLLLDLAGPRRPLTIACGLCAVGCFIFGYSVSPEWLSFGRFLMGVGSAFGFLTCIRIASDWFPPHLFSFFLGFSLLIGTMGPRFGGQLLCHLMGQVGWEKSLFIFGFGSLGIGVVSWIVVRDKKTSPVSAALRDETLTLWKSFQTVLKNAMTSVLGLLKNPQTWFYGAYGFLMYIPLSGFADLWGVPYITQTFNVSTAVANDSVMTLYLGVSCGSILWPFIVPLFKSYRFTMAMVSLLTLTFLSAAIYVPGLSLSAVNVLFFASGAAISGQFLAFTGVTQLNPPNLTATASGMHNMLCMISGILTQPMMGYVLKNFQGNDGVLNPFTQMDYHVSFLILPISLALATLSLFFMTETYNRETKLE